MAGDKGTEKVKSQWLVCISWRYKVETNATGSGGESSVSFPSFGPQLTERKTAAGRPRAYPSGLGPRA